MSEREANAPSTDRDPPTDLPDDPVERVDDERADPVAPTTGGASDASEDTEPDRTDPADHDDRADHDDPEEDAADLDDRADPTASDQQEDADDDSDGEDGAPARRRSQALSPAGALIGVLSVLLGFALVVQVRTTSSTSGLSAARQDDLVRILDDLSSREDRLRQQITSLESTLQNLTSSGDKASVALDEARTRSSTLGILTGTVAAQGPGIRLTIEDPAGELGAEDLLDALEELRAAGGEAFQVGPVRVGLSSAFTDDNGVVLLDGTPLDAPYVVLAIGDPDTLATALNIPGGVVATIRNAGGEAIITKADKIVISALRELPDSDYASPADEPDD